MKASNQSYRASLPPFWTYDRQAGEELSRHNTARAAQMAAKRFSHLTPGHEIAWGPRKDSLSMLGYCKSEVLPAFKELGFP